MTARELAEELLKNPDDIVCTYDSHLKTHIAIVGHGRFKGDTIEELFQIGPNNQKIGIRVIVPGAPGDQSFFQIL